MLQNKAQGRKPPRPLGEIALDEHGLAVEDVDIGIDVLAVHQKRHADLFHPFQHGHDLAIVGDSRCRIGGGIGGIELYPVNTPSLNPRSTSSGSVSSLR